MKTTHGKYTITYWEEEESFKVNVDGAHFQSKSLKALRKKIDNLLVPPNKFDRVPVFLSTNLGDSKFVKGYITSIANNVYGTPEVWIIDDKKTRGKKKKA